MSNIDTRPIQLLNSYISGMEKSLNDKLFWINKIPQEDYSTIIDFGCANGALLSAVNKIFPQKALIGIDSNPLMRSIASASCPSAKFYDSLESYYKENNPSNAILIFSSVLHEVFSYCTPDEIQKLFLSITTTDQKFKYICIRDMFFDISADSPNTPDNNLYFIKSLPYLNYQEKERRKQFEELYGSTKEYISRLHYLCKYRYVNNWDRELHENYFIGTLGLKYIYTLCTRYHEPIYQHFYILPFLQKQVLKDFNFDINEFYRSTHFQYIFKRRRFK